VILSDLSEGTVLADDGIGAVRVKGPDALPIRNGEFYVRPFTANEHDCDRAHLILDNRKV
jgi:hypothetical protein